MTTEAAAPDDNSPEENPTTIRTQGAQLDDATVMTKTQHYPPKAKEPVLWLATFCRDHCSRRFDILRDKARELGFKKVSDNYFYRVLTGRYFERGDDGKLVGNVENLLQIIDRLRSVAKAQEAVGKIPFIETGTYEQIANLFDAIRMPEAVCKFGVIIGPTGAQKTAAGKHYCELNNHGTCIHIEAPETPTLGTFLTDLAARYGHSKWANSSIHRRNISDSVTADRMIVVDNVQRLYMPGRNHNQPIFSYLQKLQDDKRCAIALMFAKDRADFLVKGLEDGFFEQFEGRAGGRDKFLELDDYTPREDLVKIAGAYGLSTGERTIDYLEKLSQKPGRVRILFDALQQAKTAAKGGAITLEMVKKVRGDDEKEER